MKNITMKPVDAIASSLASCYITIDGRRYNFISMKEFEAKLEIVNAEVAILGKVGTGNKPVGTKGTFSGKAHYNQSHFREIAKTFQTTGKLPYFEIQVTNEDKSSSVGRQTVILKNCLIDNVILTKFQAGTEILEEDISGTFEDFELPETFRELQGV